MSRRLGNRLVRIPPYIPIAAWVAFLGWTALPGGGIHPTGHGVVPTWLVFLWTLAFAIGATLAVIGGTTARTRVESSGLGTLLCGLVFYGLVAVFHDAHPVGVAVSVLAFVAMCALRMRVLAESRRATRTAGRIQRRQAGE